MVRDVAACVPAYWVCDGEIDCDNAEDEHNCSE